MVQARVHAGERNLVDRLGTALLKGIQAPAARFQLAAFHELVDDLVSVVERRILIHKARIRHAV